MEEKELHRKKIKKISSLFKVLGNPLRLCMLEKIISEGRVNVSELTDCMEVGQSSVSQNLAKLRDLGLVESEKVEQQVFYSCNCESLKDLMDFVKKMEEEM